MKVLKIIGSIILVLVLLLILLPFIFKGRIVEEVQKTMDENLKASVSIGDFGLSLFSTFPNFNLQIKDIDVIGKDEFENIELAKIGLIEAEIDVMSVVNGEQIKIQKVGIADAYIHVLVNADTLANYDIVVSSDSSTAEEEEVVEEESSGEESAFALAVKSYYLKNINVYYEDIPGNMVAKIMNMNHTGSGDMTADVFNFDTQTNIDELTYKMGGVNYLTEANLDVKLNIGVDMPNSKYTFNENHIGINDLMLHFDGFVAMPDEETIDLDLTFGTEKSTFKSILSLVPAIYKTDFETIETRGNLALNGSAKGKLVGDLLPAFNLNLKIDDGYFHYPDLPKAGENIAIDLNVQNPGGSDDNTLVDLKKFHIELAGNPVDLKARVSTPVSDANIDANLMMHLDLASLKDVVPMEGGEEYAGTVDADITMKGKVSTLEAEDYENFDAKGSMVLQGITYKDSSLGYPVQLNKADFQFSPQSIEMAEFDCLVGKSDIKGKGLVSGFLPYYFDDEMISGKLDLQSNLLDLNELAGESEETEESSEGEEESAEVEDTSSSEGVTEIPANIDFELNTDFKQVIYDNIEMTDMKGKVTVREQKMSMDQLAMNLLEGSMVMSGYYETTVPEKPTVDFNLDIKDFDIPKTYETFNTVEKMAPIGENALGKFSTDMKLVCALDQNMEPLTETITGGGHFKTREVQVKESDVLDQMAVLLKNDKLKDPKFEDINISYEFKDGRVFVEPFDVKMGDYKATIEGSNGFDYTLDYVVDTKIPMDAFGSDINKAAGGLLGQLNEAAGTNMKMGDEIAMKIRIGGTVQKPKLIPMLGGSSGSSDGGAFDNAKQQAKDEIDKLKKQAEDSLRKEADRLKKEAEEAARKEADRLQKEAEEAARKEAERLQKEAEEAAKREADKMKKKAEDELKNFFKKK